MNICACVVSTNSMICIKDAHYLPASIRYFFLLLFIGYLIVMLILHLD